MAEDILQGFNINSSGYGIVPKLVMQDKNIGISAKAVYAYFCSFTGSGNSCFPSRKKICEDLGISNDTLSKQLRQLSDAGYIVIEQVKEKGRFSHNIYTLPDMVLPCPKISDTEKTVYGNLDTKNNNNKNNNIYKINNKESKGKAARFTPPAREEVQAYIVENNFNVDAERFIDYYTANGWQVGKNKMKDWRATVRNWHRREQGDKQDKPRVEIWDADSLPF